MDESDAEASETDPLVTSPQPKPPPRPPSKPPPRPPRTDKQKDLAKIKDVIKSKDLGAKNDSRQDPVKKESAKVSFDNKSDREKVMEEVHLPQKKSHHFDESSAVLCPFFGVKNYLHYFYENQDSKNPILLVEGKDEAFLMKHHSSMCSSSIFKLSLFIGGFILLIGTTAFIVAMCSSRKATMMGDVGGVHFVDQLSATHNAEMDALLLVSLVAVTLGATVVAAALISRTFCSQPDYEEALRLGLVSLYKQQSIVQNGVVPATVERTPIQPWPGHVHCKTHHRNFCPP